MTYVSRAKTAIQQIKRHDAAQPSNAQLAELGQAALYSSGATQVWNRLLEENGYVINPQNSAVRDDIGVLTGTSDPPTFVPVTNGQKNAMIAALFIRLTRGLWRRWLIDYREEFANAPAVPLNQAAQQIQAQAVTDSIAILGEDSDDPES